HSRSTEMLAPSTPSHAPMAGASTHADWLGSTSTWWARTSRPRDPPPTVPEAYSLAASGWKAPTTTSPARDRPSPYRSIRHPPASAALTHPRPPSAARMDHSPPMAPDPAAAANGPHTAHGWDTV